MTMASWRVLVVDDNPSNLLLAEYVLRRAGLTVATADCATAALAAIADFGPDLILMDVQLPGMDGLSLTRQLKADVQTSGIVIVALTAYAMHGDDLRAAAAGCDGYLTKPIDVTTFGQQVVAFLDPSTHTR